VDLRERHLDYWTPCSDINPRECNSKRASYHQWCALPTRRAMVTHSSYTLPRYMLLDLPRDVIRSVARFSWSADFLPTSVDFLPTLYELKLWPGLTIPPLLVTCVILMMYRMSNMSFSTAPIHTWSPWRTYASLFSSASLNIAV